MYMYYNYSKTVNKDIKVVSKSKQKYVKISKIYAHI